MYMLVTCRMNVAVRDDDIRTASCCSWRTSCRQQVEERGRLNEYKALEDVSQETVSLHKPWAKEIYKLSPQQDTSTGEDSIVEVTIEMYLIKKFCCEIKHQNYQMSLTLDSVANWGRPLKWGFLLRCSSQNWLKVSSPHSSYMILFHGQNKGLFRW